MIRICRRVLCIVLVMEHRRFRRAALASLPILPVERPVLDRFGNVLGLDLLAGAKVGDGARDLENPVMRPGREGQAPDGHFQGAFGGGGFQRAQLAQTPWRQAGLDETAFRLAGARGQDPLAHLGGCGAGLLPAHLLVSHGRHFDVQVDAIEQRPADFAEVALNDAAGATAFVRRIAKISTWTPVQISTELEHEPRGPADGPWRLGPQVKQTVFLRGMALGK